MQNQSSVFIQVFFREKPKTNKKNAAILCRTVEEREGAFPIVCIYISQGTETCFA